MAETIAEKTPQPTTGTTAEKTAPNLAGAPALRRSPAHQLAEAFAAASAATAADPARSVSLREIPFLTQIGLRAVPGTPGAVALESALGAPLPSGHGRTTSGGGYTVVWIGPSEYLAIGQERGEERREEQGQEGSGDGSGAEDLGPAEAARLGAALGEPGARVPGAVVDLSANRTTFALSGPSARAVLEKGVSYDLHPRHFAVGTAIATVLDHVPVLLWKTGEEDYRVLPRASFADHVGRWLVDAMREFAARGAAAHGAALRGAAVRGLAVDGTAAREVA
ncbi:sarcosine oxidase subunit gamma [Sinomonas halotolerans]|uniref:Sarcosine oxidase subunit gamma family protein n=1 Tax=Sinomonas halotolerans TaxID=1644133 RepID=A0ABU9WWN5_9MICC